VNQLGDLLQQVVEIQHGRDLPAQVEQCRDQLLIGTEGMSGDGPFVCGVLLVHGAIKWSV